MRSTSESRRRIPERVDVEQVSPDGIYTTGGQLDAAGPPAHYRPSSALERHDAELLRVLVCEVSCLIYQIVDAFPFPNHPVNSHRPDRAASRRRDDCLFGGYTRVTRGGTRHATGRPRC